MDSDEVKNVWEYRVKKAFEKREGTNTDLLWELITLFLYSTSRDRLLIDIFNFFEDKNQFVKFISLVDGRTLKLPNKQDIEEALLTAVFYYEKKVNGKSWKEIQDALDFSVSPIKYGIKVRNLNSWITQKLQEILGISEDNLDVKESSETSE
jgi:hypothetical protein